MGSQWSSRRFGNGSYPYVVSSSVLTYWFVVSIIPIYNKIYFDKTLYPYPIATAGIQLGVVALLLILINVAQHYYAISECVMSGGTSGGGGGSSLCRKTFCKNDTTSTLPSSSPSSPSSSTISWIFGPHLLWKLSYTLPIGTLFGLKYAVTNWGLHLVPAPTHLLLQSTDMVWTLLSAWIINKEHVTCIGLCCVLGCVLGSACLSVRVGQTVAAPLLGIGVNLASPILLGLCITTLRLACTELMGVGNRVGGTVSSFELSALKLMISAPVALILACFLENDHISLTTTPTWLTAFLHLPLSTKLGVMGGSLFILIFQVNCTFLAFLTSAVDVGLVGQVKIIPQWIAAALFFDRTTFRVTELNGLGAFLTLMSAAVFVISDWLSYKYPDEYMGASFLEEEDDDDVVVVGCDKDINDNGTGEESQALLQDGSCQKEQYHDNCQSQQKQQQQVVVSINNYSSI